MLGQDHFAESVTMKTKLRWALGVSISVLVLIVVSCPGQGKEGAMSFQIESTAFSAGGAILKKCTCDGSDLSPQLSWRKAPEGAQSFALIMDDPDAPVGTWVHWVLYDLPGHTQGLPEGVAKEEQLDSGARQGRNDFGNIGYGGPCPPGNKVHRYFFKLYALNEKLNLKAAASKSDLERAMKGHILGQTEVMGKYGR